MKIKSVTIEGLHNCKSKTYTFNNLTYLYGHNGAGKSTVLNAIQLALLGYIPGTDKNKTAIYQHASEKAMLVRLIIEDNDGSDITIERSWIGAGSNIVSDVTVKPDYVDPASIIDDLELPIFNFGELMNMTANKLKDWFIQFLPSESAEVDWRAELSAAVANIPNMDESIIDSVMTQIAMYDETGIELVRRVNEYLKGEQSAIKARITQLQNTINSLIYYDDAPVETTEEIQAQINQLLDLAGELSKYEVALSNYQRNAHAIDQAKGKCGAASIDKDDEYAEICKMLSVEPEVNYQEKISELNATIAENTAKINANVSIINGGGVCPYTKTTCEAISEQIKPLIEANAAMTKENEAARTQVSDLTAKMRKEDNIRSINLHRKEEIEYNYKTLEFMLSGAPEYEPIAPTEMTAAEIKDKVGFLQNQMAKIEANNRYNQLIDKITQDKFHAELELEAYKVWAKLTDANGLQTKLAEDQFKALQAEITANMSELTAKDMQCHFFLSEKANSFSFGVTRDGKYITFDMLSSGEKCIYTLALLMSIVQRSKSPLDVIMIDDLLDHLDDDNASQMFNSLANSTAGIQFILAGVKACTCDSADAIITKVGE